MVHIQHLKLHNFRCFSQQSFSFDHRVVLIEGENGIGKTALLEALHYLCYLKSFRTHVPRELIRFGQEGFFIQANVASGGDCDDIHVGSTGKKRTVKINGTPITSFSEFAHHVKVVTLTEHDMNLIQGAPECRRTFIDQNIFLSDPDFAHEMQQYRVTLEQRNALFQKSCDKMAYEVWTRNLWKRAYAIQQRRIHALHQLTSKLDELQQAYSVTASIAIDYRAKRNLHESADMFLSHNSHLYDEEQRFQRTLFGVHLDDFVVRFKDHNARFYSSRGQQKLILVLAKVAQIKNLYDNSQNVVFLLDDFMTDFDVKRLDELTSLVTSLGAHIFFTSAHQKGVLYDRLKKHDTQYIKL
jgi:DNA replication and repair protein RecF